VPVMLRRPEDARGRSLFDHDAGGNESVHDGCHPKGGRAGPRNCPEERQAEDAIRPCRCGLAAEP